MVEKLRNSRYGNGRSTIRIHITNLDVMSSFVTANIAIADVALCVFGNFNAFFGSLFIVYHSLVHLLGPPSTWRFLGPADFVGLFILSLVLNRSS